MLINKTWQALPGTHSAEIYPYIRKPDLLSSNSCLIRTPEQIVVIDTGTLPAQTADLGRIITNCQEERPRPVLIYLTHCHIDHSLQAYRYQQAQATAWIAIQEEGATSLMEGDAGRTIAELYGLPFPSLQPDIRLLTLQDRKRGKTRLIRLSSHAALTVQTETISPDAEHSFIKQSVSLGGGDHLDIFPSPGHSPDSVCIQVGEVLFIGDLLSAANPMVAGISGWNRDHLIATLHQVKWLLDTRPIRLCYPGHGGMIKADKARDLLHRLLSKADCLGDVTEMNEERLFQTTDMAMELIDEAEEVFAAIAGRLLYVSYHLEQLEEAEAAIRCRAVMDMDQIDAELAEFRNLCRTLEAGDIRRVEFAHGALRTVERIKSLFDPRPLSAIIPQSLINRATCLLLDFIGIAHGCRNLEEFVPVDLHGLIADVVRAWDVTPHQDMTIIDAADDEERYLAALILRIGHEPSADRAVLRFSSVRDLPLVRLAAARFADTLRHFLDRLALADAPSISLVADTDRDGPFLTVIPERRVPSPFHYDTKKIKVFTRRFRLCGLALQTGQDGFLLRPVAEI